MLFFQNFLLKVCLSTLVLSHGTCLYLTQKRVLTAIMAPGLPGLNAASHAAVESEGACANAQIQLRPMADKIVGAWVPV